MNPNTQPATTKTSVPSRRLRGLVAAGIIGATLLTGCSFNASVGGRSINRESVEQAIVDGFETEVGLRPASMDCEGIEDLEVKAGNTHTCEGVAANGSTFEVQVTFSDEDGAFRFMVVD